MPSFCLSKWEKGNETDKEAETQKKKGRDRERESGISLSRETVPSVDTAEGNYNAAKAHI